MKPTALYRHYDKDDNLLYIGISLSAIGRYQQHRNSSHWAKNSTKMTTEWFDNRELAEKAEKEAIKREKPLHNIKFSNTKPNNIRTYDVDVSQVLRNTIIALIDELYSDTKNELLFYIMLFSEGGQIRIDKSFRFHMSVNNVDVDTQIKQLIQHGVLKRINSTNEYIINNMYEDFDDLLAALLSPNINSCIKEKCMYSGSFRFCVSKFAGGT